MDGSISAKLKDGTGLFTANYCSFTRAVSKRHFTMRIDYILDGNKKLVMTQPGVYV